MNPTTPEDPFTTEFDPIAFLEDMRSQITNLEATAYSAEKVVKEIPYIPRVPPEDSTRWQSFLERFTEFRPKFHRLLSLVMNTALLARGLLEAFENGLERAYAARRAAAMAADRGKGGGSNEGAPPAPPKAR